MLKWKIKRIKYQSEKVMYFSVESTSIKLGEYFLMVHCQCFYQNQYQALKEGDVVSFDWYPKVETKADVNGTIHKYNVMVVNRIYTPNWKQENHEIKEIIDWGDDNAK